MTTHRRSTLEQRNLLIRLGIEISEPWVWITTDGPIAGEHARWRVETSDGESIVPMDNEAREEWEGFAYDAMGRQVDVPLLGLSSRGILTQWGDDLFVSLRYQRVKAVGSVLYAELVTSATREASIQGAHLKHPATDRSKAWKALDHLLKAPQPGRPTKPVKGSDTEYWLGRVAAHGGIEALDAGESIARTEYYADTTHGPERHDYGWWDDHILRTLRRRKHRQKHSI